MKNRNGWLVMTVCLGLLLIQSGCLGPIKAEIKLDRQRYDEAVPLFQEYLKEKPQDFRARSKLGFAFLKMGRLDDAIRELSSVLETQPGDPYAVLYLGLAYLNKEDIGKAIDTWQRYRDPGSPLVEEEIRRQLTILLMVESQKQAAKALAEEEKLKAVKPDAKTVAVCNYQDLSPDSSYRAFQKGLAAMLITDLSKIKSIRVVERLRLQALLGEMRLGQTGIVDAKTAPRVGRLLGAGNVVLGNLSRGSIKATTSVSGNSPGAVSVAVEEKNFYDLPALIIKDLAKIMALTLTADEIQAIGVPHTKVFQAFVHFGEALDALDAGNWEAAKSFFKKALDADPEFRLAKEGLAGTPGGNTPDITSLTTMSTSQLAGLVGNTLTESQAAQASAAQDAQQSGTGGGGGGGG